MILAIVQENELAVSGEICRAYLEINYVVVITIVTLARRDTIFLDVIQGRIQIRMLFLG